MQTLQEALYANSLEHKLEMQIMNALGTSNKINESVAGNNLNEMLKATYKPTDFTPEELNKACNKPASDIIPLVGTDTGVVILHFPKKGKRPELYLLCNFRKPARDITGLLVDPETFVNYRAYKYGKWYGKYFPDLKLEDADRGGVFAMRVLNYLNPGMWEFLYNDFSMNSYFNKTIRN